MKLNTLDTAIKIAVSGRHATALAKAHVHPENGEHPKPL